MSPVRLIACMEYVAVVKKTVDFLFRTLIGVQSFWRNETPAVCSRGACTMVSRGWFGTGLRSANPFRWSTVDETYLQLIAFGANDSA